MPAGLLRFSGRLPDRRLITGEVSFNFFTIVAVAIIAVTIYLLFRPNKYAGVNEVQFDSKKAVASK